MPSFTAHFDSKTQTIVAANADEVFEEIATQHGIDITHILVYADNPVPHANATYGAPMGRMSRPLDHDGTHKAVALTLDEGYDDGGAYWGMRPSGQSLFAVQDGYGNVAFVDGTSPQNAIENALA